MFCRLLIRFLLLYRSSNGNGSSSLDILCRAVDVTIRNENSHSKPVFVNSQTPAVVAQATSLLPVHAQAMSLLQPQKPSVNALTQREGMFCRSKFAIQSRLIRISRHVLMQHSLDFLIC